MLAAITCASPTPIPSRNLACGSSVRPAAPRVRRLAPLGGLGARLRGEGARTGVAGPHQEELSGVLDHLPRGHGFPVSGEVLADRAGRVRLSAIPSSEGL